jgi:hypothetical protein
MGRVLPDQQDGMQDWHEQLSHIVEFFGWINKFLEELR